MIRKITNTPYNTIGWRAEIEISSFMKKGHYNIFISEYNSYDESDILAGSTVDIRGVIYTFTTDQTPTGTVSTGINYIRMNEDTLEYSIVAPVYNYELQGWYDSSTNLKRYIYQFEYNDPVYSGKVQITDKSSQVIQIKEKTDELKKGTHSTMMSFMNGTEVRLAGTDTVAGDKIGRSISIDGDYMISGAFKHNSEGAAYVFHKEDDTGYDVWDTGTKLVSSDIATGDGFGRNVAIDGDYAVVAARSKDSNTGAVYIFHRTDTNTWDSGVRVVGSDTAVGDFFGVEVAISGDYVIVGAYNNGTGGAGAGAAYIFHRTGTNTWDTGTKVISSDLTAGDNYGIGVGISGDYAVVAARFSGTDGAAYAFLRTGTNTWDTGTKLVAPDAVAGDRFGATADIDGDRIVVGANYVSYGSITNAGCGYIFERTGSNTWDSGVKIDPGIRQEFNYTGVACVINGDYAALSGYALNGETGVTWLYHKNDDDFWECTCVRPRAPFLTAKFGQSVGLSGNYLAVGSVLDPILGVEAGMAYVYKINEED